MSKIICSAAIRGAHKIFARAETEWQQAMDRWGSSQDVGFPNTAYYLPIIYGILGMKVEKLGDMEPVLQRCRDILPPPVSEHVHLPYLAGSLHNLGTSLTAAGQHEQALAATREAVYIRRTLPDTHLPDLAASLNNLGRIYADTGRRDHALQATREAVTLYGALVQQLPQAHSQDFLRSVRNLARQLQEVERSPEEDLTMQWAIEIIEKLGLDRQPE